ncbi:MAG: hypothetical protein GQ580_07940 [Candidatus Thorarchaeota archaeon]|nr:hypothetical protein [Candidatus Thorarchaeota archaeon]
MSDVKYSDIELAWEQETANENLQDLEDLKLSRMISYLSEVRVSLANTKAEDQLQADLFTQEALNVEFMLNDLLILRQNKILKDALAQRRPIGTMTLAEEEFYNRLLRGVEGHQEFIKGALIGTPPSATKQSTRKKRKKGDNKSDDPPEEATDYVLVRFLRPIKDAFMGLDEVTYGPFKKEDIATIPTENAHAWLRDGTISRVVPEELEAKK